MSLSTQLHSSVCGERQTQMLGVLMSIVLLNAFLFNLDCSCCSHRRRIVHCHHCLLHHHYFIVVDRNSMPTILSTYPILLSTFGSCKKYTPESFIWYPQRLSVCKCRKYYWTFVILTQHTQSRSDNRFGILRTCLRWGSFQRGNVW